MIGFGELINQTGASKRQIDYWCRTGILPTIGDHAPGSGYKREFDEAIVPIVKLLVDISKAFEGCTPHGLARKVFENYQKGYVNLGDGIILSWRFF